MRGPREVLNELKWRDGSLAGVEVAYVHRGAPGDVNVVRAEDITDLGRSFFTVTEKRGPSSIPYHRVLVVARRGAPIWERRRAP